MLHAVWKYEIYIYLQPRTPLTPTAFEYHFKKPYLNDHTWIGRRGPCVIGGVYLLWGSRGVESAGADQEGVRLRFAVLHLGVVPHDNVVKEAEEAFVSARLQLERHVGWAGCHGDGDGVLLEMAHEFLHAWFEKNTFQSEE